MNNIYKLIRRVSGKFILSLLIIALGSGNMYAQHLFSVDYGDLSQENARLIKTKATRLRTPVSTMSMTRNRENKEVYSFSLASIQNTKIVILNEETGNSVVITPVKGAPAQFELPPFFIEELRQAALGEAERYLVVETGSDFSVRKAASVSAASREVFIPRYMYGSKGNIKEALPKDRKITHIFKQKPILIPAFPDDPENVRLKEKLEEEMSYYVYMYQLPDGSLIIYDEHFNPVESNTEKQEISRSANAIANRNLQFNLTGNLTGAAQTATLQALNIWSEQLAGEVPVDINVDLVPIDIDGKILGRSFRGPIWYHVGTETWYPTARANEILGVPFAPNMLEINLQLNSNNYWHYEKTSNPLYGYDDWITVMLHEVTHGLGFFSLCGSNGEYLTGYSSPKDKPGIFDRQLYQGDTGNICLADLTQSERAELVTSNNLYAGRPSSYLVAANGGKRVKMYAPSDWAEGSSVSHWDTYTYNSFINFMEPFYLTKVHTINERKIAIMRDIGWEIPCPTKLTPTFSSVQTIYCSGLSIPALPTTSDQGVTGTWSPAINNTATTTYTFTPTAGQCATLQTLTLTINGVTNLVNQTITTDRTVTNNCSDINVQNVQVQNGAMLKLDSPGRVIINGPFKVQPGSTLKIKK